MDKISGGCQGGIREGCAWGKSVVIDWAAPAGLDEACRGVYGD